VDDLDFIDLISVAEYSEEWEKKKKPIQKKIRRYYLLHEVGVKVYSCPRRVPFCCCSTPLQLPAHLPAVAGKVYHFHAFTRFRLVKACNQKNETCFCVILFNV